MINSILIGIIALCFLGIIFIAVRKFSALSSINIKATSKHKQDEVKVEIIEDRVNRRFQKLGSFLAKIFSPLLVFLKGKFWNLYRRANERSDFYQKEDLRLHPEAVEGKAKVTLLIKEGVRLLEEENYPEAEKKFIEAVSLDNTNLAGFEGLSRVYLLKKDYEHARETLEYILKINPHSTMALCEMGEIASSQGDNKNAIVYLHKALDIEPNSPKCLSYLIELAILEGNKNTGLKALKKLKEVNPENKNLKIYEKKIKEL